MTTTRSRAKTRILKRLPGTNLIPSSQSSRSYKAKEQTMTQISTATTLSLLRLLNMSHLSSTKVQLRTSSKLRSTLHQRQLISTSPKFPKVSAREVLAARSRLSTTVLNANSRSWQLTTTSATGAILVSLHPRLRPRRSRATRASRARFRFHLIMICLVIISSRALPTSQ